MSRIKLPRRNFVFTLTLQSTTPLFVLVYFGGYIQLNSKQHHFVWSSLVFANIYQHEYFKSVISFIHTWMFSFRNCLQFRLDKTGWMGFLQSCCMVDYNWKYIYRYILKIYIPVYIFYFQFLNLLQWCLIVIFVTM